MDGSTALILIAIGGIVTFLVTSKLAGSKRTRQRTTDQQVVDLLKRQRQRKKRRIVKQRENYAKAKADYEKKFGPFVNGDDGSGNGKGPNNAG